MGARFCEVCCGPHEAAAPCPGELPATGAETPAWEVAVETPRGLEQIAVLLAPSRDLWRARISTRPRTLWLVPGGAATLKFAGGTREQAVQRAIAFVNDHCAMRGYLRRDQLRTLEGVQETPRLHAARPPRAIPLRRARLRLPLRWGTDGPSLLAATHDVSVAGMFVATRNPAEPGTPLQLRLDVAGTSASLEALVMWRRTAAERDRPIGMGVRLIHPPRAYSDFVIALTA